MNVTLERCETCGGLVDAEDLFCANCGTEVPDSHGERGERVAMRAQNFQCKGCGATMNYDASAQTLKCPFCGSLDLAADASQGILAPELVIPFAIDRAEAENRLRGWLGSSFWHPNDLRDASQLTELKAVYVPFWMLSTDVKTHWTADTSQTPPGASASWYPISGYAERSYADLWISAGSGIPANEVQAILPFDAAAGVPPERIDLVDITVEQFAVSRRYARPLTQSVVESLETQAVASEVPGNARNVHVNVLMEGATSRAALAPIYVVAYRYRNAVYRYVLNGQTGRETGAAPTSVTKVAGVVLAIVLIVVVLLLLIAH